MDNLLLDNARDYYGTQLGGSGDLRTDACTTSAAPPAIVQAALANIHTEVRQRYYGCGLVAPHALAGASILDLGCGSGQDCYVLAQLAGPDGRVTGIDATPQQLAVAREHTDWHQARFGFARPTVSFVDGDIRDLAVLGLEPESFDVIVSNCVINLVDDKAAVFTEARALLKPGGEIYFSDVYADRRLPPELLNDPVLHGECLAGALYWNDFLTLARQADFADPRLVEDRPLAIADPAIEQAVAPARFFSATYRLMKIDGLEPECEDYGQAVRYRGSLTECPQQFLFDKRHLFARGRIVPVCGNSWNMLHQSRFAQHFDFFGDFSAHHGIFPGCGTDLPFDREQTGAPAAACC